MEVYINIFIIIFLIIYFIDLFIIKKIYVENLYLKKKDSSTLRSALHSANNDLPIMPGDGYNTVPSDLMRQYANISGHYYK
jgi:hypothetical protein